MRKINSNYENPLDNILINIADNLCPIAYNYKFTPNILTTISLIFCGISALLLLNSYYFIAALFFLISYYFDCMDGHFARKYNMVTKFGDYYDHVADITKILLILYIFYIIDSKKFFITIPFVILFLTALDNSICESYGFNFIFGIVSSYLVSKINFGLELAILNNLIPYFDERLFIIASRSSIISFDTLISYSSKLHIFLK